MFQSFNDFVLPSATQGPTSTTGGPSRSQRKVNRSCAECRRRKIRCDGELPCGNCKWYRVEGKCEFMHRSKRRAVSAKSVEELAQTVSHQQNVLEELFPSQPLESLVGLSREELLQVIAAGESNQEATTLGKHNITVNKEMENSNEERQLEENWNFSKGSSNVYDDVNGLSLSFDRQQTSPGISSVRFILRLIIEGWPVVKSSLRQKSKMSSRPKLSSHQLAPGEAREPALAGTTCEKACIDAYFATAHAITPMIDESQFHRDYNNGSRRDTGWLALRSMVLVVGSIAASNIGSQDSHAYYESARQYIGIESFGSTSIESLLALCLLGGYYLHYRNTPNMASAVLGAAFRMATALGLHRETSENQQKQQSLGASISSAEIRRRTWWSLFCLDTWASMTLGRPTFGRWDPDTMNVSPPRYDEEPNHSDIIISAFRASVGFCKLATKIQERLAQPDLLGIDEISDFDIALKSWYEQFLKGISSKDCPKKFIVAKDYMQNRYMNIRMLLFRPVLLSHVECKTPFEALTEDDKGAIFTCQQVSLEAIRNIAGPILPNQFWVWGSTWYLYQACLVPLLILLAYPHRFELTPCHEEIEQAIVVFKAFIPWNTAAWRSHDVIESIYEASKTLPALEIGEDVPAVLAELDMEIWDLATAGFEYDYGWESFINWEKDFTPDVEN
ncbi:hypothetical protein BBP40_011139 [Aspergillus hancockii]|nr:hypothetical protein BBP40_011139 [Aspergillus hancockii]